MPASKFNRAIVGVAILISTITAYAFAAAPGDLVDYRWLANHPARSLLSFGGELALQDNLRRWAALAKSASTVTADSQPIAKSSTTATLDRPGSFVVPSGVNKLVNDPSNDTNPQTTQSEPSIAVFGQRVVVGYNDTKVSAPVPKFSGYTISVDGGSTFIDKGEIPADPAMHGNFGDPVLGVDNKGDFYYATLFKDATDQMRIGVARSVDGGENFSTPIIASRGPEIVSGDFLDKPWITVDEGTNTIYVVWIRLRAGPSWAIQFSSSTDGVNFTDARTLRSIVVAAPGGLNGAQVTVGINGEVFVAWTNLHSFDNSTIEFCEVPASGPCNPVTISSNFPRTGTVRICGPGVDPNQVVLNGDIRIFDYPSLAVDRTNGIHRGKIYLAWTQKIFLPFGQVDQAEVYFSRRDASGGPWLAPRQVKVDPKDQFFPAVAVSNDGTLGVMYYSREDDANNRLIHVYMARSTDAGDTFSYQRATDLPNGFDVPPLNPNFDVANPCYMGDYNQIIASDGENFYFVWGDNRDTVRYGRPDPDVFFTAITTQPRTYFAQVVDGGGWKTKFLATSSSVTNIAAGLRQDASGAQNTNFPVFSGTFPTTSYFADVVNGGGWTTDFGSANLSDALSGTVTVETFTQSGAPWSILPGGISQTFNLAPRGSGFVETIGGAAFQRGWARIRVTNSRHIGSFQVHQQRAGGPISAEAGDVSRVATKFSHTFGLNSPNTGYAVSNDSTTTATVTFELFNSTGASQGTSNLTLGPGQQQVKALTDLFPGAPAIPAGSLRITSTSAPGTSAPVAVRALRLDGALLATYPIF